MGSVSNFKYYIIFIVDFSRMTWLYLLLNRSEVSSCFARFIKEESTQHSYWWFQIWNVILSLLMISALWLGFTCCTIDQKLILVFALFIKEVTTQRSSVTRFSDLIMLWNLNLDNFSLWFMIMPLYMKHLVPILLNKMECQRENIATY